MSRASSMTGFGQGDASSTLFTINVEVKSVNHRFKDIRFKLPSLLSNISGLEFSLRKLLEESCKRGSFDIFASYKKSETSEAWDLDEEKVKSFIQTIERFTKGTSAKLEIRPTEFLRKEFERGEQESLSKELETLVTKALGTALIGLKDSRKKEGAKLILAINSHLAEYKKNFKTIEDNVGSYKKGVEDRLRKKMSEYAPELKMDDGRFLQEVVYYLEKLDVHEEINRIHAHLDKTEKLLEKSDEVGRELDFILQELGRETNTIGSKSASTIISDAVIQMKVQLEKIREQALNLE